LRFLKEYGYTLKEIYKYNLTPLVFENNWFGNNWFGNNFTNAGFTKKDVEEYNDYLLNNYNNIKKYKNKYLNEINIINNAFNSEGYNIGRSSQCKRNLKKDINLDFDDELTPKMLKDFGYTAEEIFCYQTPTKNTLMDAGFTEDESNEYLKNDKEKRRIAYVSGRQDIDKANEEFRDQEKRREDFRLFNSPSEIEKRSRAKGLEYYKNKLR